MIRNRHGGDNRRRCANISPMTPWRILLVLFAILSTPATAKPAEKLVLAFGDSLTAGYRLRPGEGFAPQLETALRKQGVIARVHNAGVSGDTTAMGRARLGWVLGSLKAKPDLVIVELGANDMLRGLDPKAAEANLDAIIGELKRRKIKVLVAGMVAAPNLGADYARRFNPIYRRLADRHGVALYPFFLEGVVNDPGLHIGDAIHPNARGVAVIVRGIAPHVSRILTRP